MNQGDQDKWRYATHEGARLAMLQRNLTLTVRQRLEEMQALNQLSERFAHMRALRSKEHCQG